LIVTASITPILLIENKEYANAMLLLSDDEVAQAAKKMIYSNPKYTEVLEHLIPKYTADGVI
jgi:hypothetical protein